MLNSIFCIYLNLNFFSIICARFMNNVLSATQLRTLLWKFKILQWFVWRSMGTTLDLNKLWGQIECVVNINFATLFKVSSCIKFIIGLTNINFYTLDCITHVKKILIPFGFFILFCFWLLHCWIFLTWEKNNCERVSPKPLINFSNCVQNHGIFYHVIFYKKLLFFAQIILMNWS